MYHIKKDARSQKSAEIIYQALRNILWKKSLNEVNITDIHKECGVSRMTFYRLFDNVVDVLSWKLSICIEQYNEFKKDKKNKLLFFFEYWQKHIYLISLLSANNKFVLSNLIARDRDLNNTYEAYLIEVKTNIMATLLSQWAKRGGKETAVEMKNIALKIFSENILILTNI